MERPRHFEDNVLYDDEAGTLAGRGCALRVRRTEAGAVLTYKGPREVRPDGLKSRPELETHVADGEALDAILRGLGYRRAFRYQKYREVYAFDDVEIDLERRMVTRGGELVQLSRTEWLLLQHLAANAGKVVLHTELLTKVWGPEYRDDLQYLRVWVSRVRRKLGAAPGEPGRIRTFQGIGYLLDVEPPATPAEVEVEEKVDERAALIG